MARNYWVAPAAAVIFAIGTSTSLAQVLQATGPNGRTLFLGIQHSCPILREAHQCALQVCRIAGFNSGQALTWMIAAPPSGTITGVACWQ